MRFTFTPVLFAGEGTMEVKASSSSTFWGQPTVVRTPAWLRMVLEKPSIILHFVCTWMLKLFNMQ